MEELKPCPRCGGEAAIATVRYNKDFAEKEGWGQSEFYYVNCTRFACGVETRGTGGLKTPESAAERWNTRPIEDALRTECARLKERCEAYREAVELAADYIGDESAGSMEFWEARAKLAALEGQPCP